MLKYIKQTHSQILLLLFLLSAVFFHFNPQIDLKASTFFFDNRFYLKGSLWESIVYDSVAILLLSTIIPAALLCAVNLLTGKNFCTMTPRRFLYLFLVLIIGAGSIVNLGLKSHSGRARPVHIEQFNGDKTFTPAFAFADQCERNCSFSSGHSAGAFFFLALAMLFRQRKALLLVAFAYGAVVSLARIAAGGHFFSDCVTSFFIMAITADLLYTLMQPNGAQKPETASELADTLASA